MPDAEFGELPAARLLVARVALLDEAQVLAHVMAHLARLKRPRLIRFVTGLPKTPIGKIQKNIIEEPFWQGRKRQL